MSAQQRAHQSPPIRDPWQDEGSRRRNNHSCERLLHLTRGTEDFAEGPLWNLVLTGYPSSGKTLLARRLVQDSSNFVRISGDDLRKMFFNEPIASRDEELPYSMLTIIRNELLRRQYNIIIDTTAPTNLTRSYLIRTKVPNVDDLLIVVVADRDSLLERTRARGHFGAVEAWDRFWELPARGVQPTSSETTIRRSSTRTTMCLPNSSTAGSILSESDSSRISSLGFSGRLLTGMLPRLLMRSLPGARN